MQVRSGDAAGRSHETHDVTRRNVITLLDVDSRDMREHREHTGAVIDDAVWRDANLDQAVGVDLAAERAA